MAKIKGSNGKDKLWGTNEADTIFGRGGNDTIFGRGGNDKISGDDGDDKIFGGAGHDWIDGGKGNDKIFGGKGIDTIYGGAGNDWIDGGTGNDFVDGGDGNDKIFGGKGNDTIYGGAGNDWIDGGKGTDTIYGGAGNDWIDGGKGNDIVDGGDGDDKIFGGKGDDTIFGGDGNDRIKGGSGNDLVTGGEGADKLTGNSGNDHFIYLANSDSPAGWGWDRITDFTQGQDKIDLAALLVSTDLAWGNTTATANGAWYQNSGSSTFVFADTTGDGEADLKIELKHTHGLNLTVDDFIGVSEAQVNNAPVITSNDGGDSAAVNVAENTTAVTTVAASDPDADDTQTFSLAGGADMAKFSIVPATGVLTFNVAPDFENLTDANLDNVYDVVVQVSDGLGGIDMQAITVTMTDVNEFTVSAVSDTNAVANAVDENAVNGALVGVTAFAADADGTTNVVTYGLDNTAGGRFTIAPATGAMSVADGSLLDYEAATSHLITVRATSADGSFSTQDFMINLNDVNEAPVSGNDNVFTDIALGTSFNIPEWSLLANDSDPEGSAIDVQSVGGQSGLTAVHSAGTGTNGFVMVTDANAGDSFTYQATDGSLVGAAATVNLIQADSGSTTYRFALDAGNNIIRDSSGIDTIIIETNGVALSSLNFARSGANDLVIEFNGQQITVLGQYTDTGNQIENIQFEGGASFQGYVLGSGTTYALPTFTNGGYPPGNNVIIGQSSGGEVMAGGDGNDLLFGNGGNDSPFNGLGGDDLLVGGVDNDDMNGHTGDDVLVGGAGNDTLTGGLGDDIFDYNAISDSGVGPGNRDVITDFQAVADRLAYKDLMDLLAIDADAGTGGDQAFGFGGSNPSVVAHNVTWHQTGSVTIVQGDVSGDTTADFQIELTGLHTLAAGDFIL